MNHHKALLRQLSKKSSRTIMLGLVLAILVLVGTSSVTLAGLFEINTDDGTVADWDEVEVFQTDPIGDIGRFVNAGNDIVMAKVASGKENDELYLYFLVQTAESPAVPGRGRAVAAIIDCDRNGDDTEITDRHVVYLPDHDRVYVMLGNSDWYAPVPDDSATGDGDPTFGQRIGNFIEWKIPLSSLPPGDDSDQTVDCKNNVDIRFETQIAPLTFLSQMLDTTEPPEGWNIPTALTVTNFSAEKDLVGMLEVLSLWVVGLLLVTMSGWAMVVKRSSSSDKELD
jgi:hypothetical protein